MSKKDYRGLPASMPDVTDITGPDSHVKLIQTFKPLGWQKNVLNDLSPVLLLTGSAGGGKSHIAAEKVHAACLRYPNSEWIVARKVKEDVLKSSYKLFQRKVIGKDPRVKYRAEEIVYDNGSVIYFVGMRGEREREAIRSIGTGGADGAWFEEAHEFEEKDFDEILGRVRGKNMGWTQILLSTNPNVPLHWIRVRLIIGGEATVFLSEESDNPHNDSKYRRRLRNMSGVEGKRLRDGLWVETTGLVIDTWKDDFDNDLPDRSMPVGNVTLDAEYNPNGGPVEIWADDGYAGEYDPKTKFFSSRSHPRVFLLVQETSEGMYNVFAESYAVQLQAPEHIQRVLDMCDEKGWERPSLAVYDSASPSLGSYLTSAKIRATVPATKNLDDSLTVLRKECAPDGNGRRMVKVHPRCRMLRLELASWTFGKDGRPGKYQDNGPDALRYGIYHHKGPNAGNSDMGSDEDIESNRSWQILMDKIDREYDKYTREVGIKI